MHKNREPTAIGSFGLLFNDSKFLPDSTVLALSDAPLCMVWELQQPETENQRGGTLPRTKRLHNVSRLEAGMQNTKHT